MRFFNRLSNSAILKTALFATGLSGIVAEYILSTLATYFLGDSVLQWTMIVSTMLFSMGLGSRISKLIDRLLPEAFVIIEFVLSVMVSFSSLLVYSLAAYTELTGVLIYTLSILIGVLIGMEIPIVIRINDQFESLKVNVSGVMEKDYYGSLLGGVFFAFVGLPFLGLTYTPFILGVVNFSVALLVLLKLQPLFEGNYGRRLTWGAASVALIIGSGVLTAGPIVRYGEQSRYKDKVIYEEQSAYQKIVITQWKNNYWLYLNGNTQLSTLDEWLYHEPLVHPAMLLARHPQDVLILGGGDGCAAREVLKYPSVRRVVLVDLDPAMTRLAREHPIFTRLNEHSLADPRVEIINADAFNWLLTAQDFFDVILTDFPDPKTVEISRLFSVEFYEMCRRQLRPHGVICSQAGSPYYATKAFLSVQKTMTEAGFRCLPLHNQVLSLGEWGWVLGTQNPEIVNLKEALLALRPDSIPTRWLNAEALHLISSFGKPLVPLDSGSVRPNRLHDPVLTRYYREGNWEVY